MQNREEEEEMNGKTLYILRNDIVFLSLPPVQYRIYTLLQIKLLTSAPATSATFGWPRFDLTLSYAAFESPHVISRT